MMKKRKSKKAKRGLQLNKISKRVKETFPNVFEEFKKYGVKIKKTDKDFDILYKLCKTQGKPIGSKRREVIIEMGEALRVKDRVKTFQQLEIKSFLLLQHYNETLSLNIPSYFRRQKRYLIKEGLIKENVAPSSRIAN